MKLSVEITFRDMPASEALEAKIQEKAQKLLQVCDRIISCRVVVEANHKHQNKGNLYHVSIDLTVPGQEIVVSRDPSANQAHEDAYVAVRDAFNAARRQVEKFASVNRRQSKVYASRETHPQGRIMELIPMEDYGRILTQEGREIYFHRNSLSKGDFDKLEIGDQVKFNEVMGDQGPQASVVHPM